MRHFIYGMRLCFLFSLPLPCIIRTVRTMKQTAQQSIIQHPIYAATAAGIAKTTRSRTNEKNLGHAINGFRTIHFSSSFALGEQKLKPSDGGRSAYAISGLTHIDHYFLSIEAHRRTSVKRKLEQEKEKIK